MDPFQVLNLGVRPAGDNATGQLLIDAGQRYQSLQRGGVEVYNIRRLRGCLFAGHRFAALFEPKSPAKAAKARAASLLTNREVTLRATRPPRSPMGLEERAMSFACQSSRRSQMLR
jgi:hypothetical protein